MVDSSVLPTTIIQTIATLYSFFIAIFIYLYSKNGEKTRYRIGYIRAFEILSFVVVVVLFYNGFILFLMHNNLTFISLLGLDSMKHNWSFVSYSTFIISIGLMVTIATMILRDTDIAEKDEGFPVSNTEQTENGGIRPITNKDESLFIHGFDTFQYTTLFIVIIFLCLASLVQPYGILFSVLALLIFLLFYIVSKK